MTRQELIDWAKIVLPVEVLIFALVAVAGRWIGWDTLEEYAQGLFLAGFGLALLGAIALGGSSGIQTGKDVRSDYAKTLGNVAPSQLARLARKDLDNATNFSLLMGVMGGIPLLVSVLTLWLF